MQHGVDRPFGSGWISGMLSVAFAGLGYGGVLCLLFPWLLTTPDARPVYPLSLMRALIHAWWMNWSSQTSTRETDKNSPS